jgi:hypothetical protein
MMASAPPSAAGPSRTTGPSRSGLLRDIGVNAVLPYLTYPGLTRCGIDTVPALAAGALFPGTAAVITIVRQRRVAALGALTIPLARMFHRHSRA